MTLPFHWASPAVKEAENGVGVIDGLGANKEFHSVAVAFK